MTRFLLDSHTLIWAVDAPAKVAPKAILSMRSPTVERFISTATIWEMAIKFGKGTLPLSLPYRQWIDRAIADLNLDVLPITLDHAEFQTTLPFHHRDPFDRLLAAQSLVEGIPLISGDAIFDAYGVSRIWN